MYLANRRKHFTSGFIPANALAWYDASDTATIAGSPAVTQLDDKIGTEHLVQGSAANRMSTGTRTHNGLNVLDGDGADFMEKTSFPIPSDGNVVFYIVAGIDSVSASSEAIVSVDGGTDFSLNSGNSSNFRASLPTSAGTNISAFGSNKNGPSLYKVVFDKTGANQFSVFVDGVENPDGPNTYSTQLSTSQTLKIFDNNSGTNRAPDGFFAELIIVPAVDTDIEDELKAKWNTP